MHELREYQLADCVDIETSSARRVLYTLPTGGGKTTVAVQVIADAVDAGEPVLFLAHRKELIDQAVARLLSAGVPKEWIGIIRASEETNPKAVIQVASIQTLINRKKPKAKLVVVDEAHHSEAETYKTIVGWYPKARILGLTRQSVCAGYEGHECREQTSAHAFRAQQVKQRNGAPWRCLKCACNTPERRKKLREISNRPDQQMIRAEQLSRGRTARKSEVSRRRQGEDMRRRHKDPEYRAKYVAGVRKYYEERRAEKKAS